MIKDFFIVGAGSFLGGGARFLVSRMVQSYVHLSFPLGTFVVNVLGCLLIGFFSGLSYDGGWMSPSTRLVLTTGFCGGFTTFSTFISESTTLGQNDNPGMMALYIFGSLAVGLVCVLAGHGLARAL